jgi:anti-sigma factor RsiW
MRECLDEGTLQGYFDGELSSRATENVAAHLASCGACASTATEIQNEIALLSTALEPEFAMTVPSAHLRSRIDEAIVGLNEDRNQRAVEPNPRSWFNFGKPFAGFPSLAFSYGAAAAIVLAVITIGILYLNRSTSTPQVNEARNVVPAPVSGSETTKPMSSRKPDSTTDSTSAPIDDPRLVNASYVPKRIAPRSSTNNEAGANLLPGERDYIKTIAALEARVKSNDQPLRAGVEVEYEHNLALVDQAIAQTRVAAQKNPKDRDAAEFMLSAYQSKVELMTQIADARVFNSSVK